LKYIEALFIAVIAY